MDTVAKYVKLANLLDKLGKYKEAEQVDRLLEKLAGHGCNCENEACEKLQMHHPAHCDNPAGKFKALYIGHVCDECAANLPHEYLIDTSSHKMPDRIAGVHLDKYLDEVSVERAMRYHIEQALSSFGFFQVEMALWHFEKIVALLKNFIDGKKSKQASLLKESGNANDYLDAALRNVQELSAQFNQMPEMQNNYSLNKILKELDYHLKMVKNSLT